MKAFLTLLAVAATAEAKSMDPKANWKGFMEVRCLPEKNILTFNIRKRICVKIYFQKGPMDTRGMTNDGHHHPHDQHHHGAAASAASAKPRYFMAYGPEDTCVVGNREVMEGNPMKHACKEV